MSTFSLHPKCTVYASQFLCAVFTFEFSASHKKCMIEITFVGATVLHGVMADVFLTGEMSHHEVLNATSQGTSVILCEHSNTERGYLTVMKQKLQQVLSDKIKITISEVDCDPIVVI